MTHGPTGGLSSEQMAAVVKKSRGGEGRIKGVKGPTGDSCSLPRCYQASTLSRNLFLQPRHLSLSLPMLCVCGHLTFTIRCFLYVPLYRHTNGDLDWPPAPSSSLPFL
jgi:hypothetical protein